MAIKLEQISENKWSVVDYVDSETPNADEDANIHLGDVEYITLEDHGYVNFDAAPAGCVFEGEPHIPTNTTEQMFAIAQLMQDLENSKKAVGAVA